MTALVAWDGVDPRWLTAESADGSEPLLPGFSAVEDLELTEPPDPHVIWTCAITGQTGDLHGILHAWRRAGAGQLRRAEASDRRVPVLWDALTRPDQWTVAVNWPATAHEPPRDGLVIVADEFFRDSAAPGAVSAADLAAELRPHLDAARQVQLNAIPGLTRLVDDTHAPAELADDLLTALRRAVAVHNVATALALACEPELLLVRYELGRDTLLAVTRHWPPSAQGVLHLDWPAPRAIIRAMIATLKGMLLRLAEILGPRSDLFLASDHRYHFAPRWAPKPTAPGEENKKLPRVLLAPDLPNYIDPRPWIVRRAADGAPAAPCRRMTDLCARLASSLGVAPPAPTPPAEAVPFVLRDEVDDQATVGLPRLHPDWARTREAVTEETLLAAAQQAEAGGRLQNALRLYDLFLRRRAEFKPLVALCDLLIRTRQLAAARPYLEQLCEGCPGHPAVKALSAAFGAECVAAGWPEGVVQWPRVVAAPQDLLPVLPPPDAPPGALMLEHRSEFWRAIDVQPLLRRIDELQDDWATRLQPQLVACTACPAATPAEAVPALAPSPFLRNDHAARHLEVEERAAFQKLRDTGLPHGELPREQVLLDAHSALLAHREYAGRWAPEQRCVPCQGLDGLQTFWFAAPHASDIAAYMRRLTRALESAAADPKFHPVLLASAWLADLGMIHPFQDGNGRIGRLGFQSLLCGRGLTLAARIDWEQRFDHMRVLFLARLASVNHSVGGRFPESYAARWPMFCAGLVANAFEDYVAAARRVLHSAPVPPPPR
jgi:hypothetical protein